MCRQCKLKPVYEFTNKRKLCRICFIKYFQKKVLYIIRKFGMIRNNDVVGYKKSNDFRGVVLEDVLKMFEKKGTVNIVKLSTSQYKLLTHKFARDKKVVNKKTSKSNVQLILHQHKASDLLLTKYQKFRAKRGKLKIATPSTIDIETNEIIHTLIQDDEKNLKRVAPIDGIVVKPLYLFLDEEVLLYSKLKRLKFKKVKEEKSAMNKFIDGLEKKHPEVKRAVVKSYLRLG